MEPQENIIQPNNQVFKISKIKQISSIFGVLLLVAGLSTGVALVQQQQDIREKAATSAICNSATSGLCGPPAGCAEGDLCTGNVCSHNAACDYPMCPSTDCNLPISLSDAVYCIGNNGRLTTCCPTNKPLYDVDKKACVASGGGGSPPSDGGGECSSASAKNCQGKDPGDECKTGKTCEVLKKKGADRKVICECKAKPSGGDDGDDDDSPGTGNPAKIGPFTSAGTVSIFFQPKTYKIKVALKKNADICSLSDKDVLLESSSFSSTGVINTGVSVASGDSLCIYIENIGTDTSKAYPALGWAAPTDNKCGQGGYEKVDISSLISQVNSAGLTAFSTQCWGDYGEEPDYNDFALIFTLSSASARPSLCKSMTVTKTGESTTITSTAKESVNNFTYAFYNNDNLKGPNDPKPICVTSGGDVTGQTSACPTGSYHLIYKDSNTSSRTTGTKTIANENIFVVDKNNNSKVVTSAHILAYFSKTNGPTSLPEGDCVVDILSTSSTTPTTPPSFGAETLDILFRLQGITVSRKAEGFTITIEKDGSQVKKLTNLEYTSNSTGVFEAEIDSSTFCSSTDSFDVLIKGQSHLAKKFENVSINCDGVVLNKSTATKDELKAGDVNGDNLLTVEDIAKVLSYYTTFSTAVTSGMETSDINKDGYITIVDVALVALNWSDFVIEGDK